MSKRPAESQLTRDIANNSAFNGVHEAPDRVRRTLSAEEVSARKVFPLKRRSRAAVFKPTATQSAQAAQSAFNPPSSFNFNPPSSSSFNFGMNQDIPNPFTDAINNPLSMPAKPTPQQELEENQRLERLRRNEAWRASADKDSQSASTMTSIPSGNNGDNGGSWVANTVPQKSSFSNTFFQTLSKTQGTFGIQNPQTQSQAQQQPNHAQPFFQPASKTPSTFGFGLQTPQPDTQPQPTSISGFGLGQPAPAQQAAADQDTEMTTSPLKQVPKPFQSLNGFMGFTNQNTGKSNTFGAAQPVHPATPVPSGSLFGVPVPTPEQISNAHQKGAPSVFAKINGSSQQGTPNSDGIPLGASQFGTFTGFGTQPSAYPAPLGAQQSNGTAFGSSQPTTSSFFDRPQSNDMNTSGDRPTGGNQQVPLGMNSQQGNGNVARNIFSRPLNPFDPSQSQQQQLPLFGQSAATFSQSPQQLQFGQTATQFGQTKIQSPSFWHNGVNGHNVPSEPMQRVESQDSEMSDPPPAPSEIDGGFSPMKEVRSQKSSAHIFGQTREQAAAVPEEEREEFAPGGHSRPAATSGMPSQHVSPFTAQSFGSSAAAGKKKPVETSNSRRADQETDDRRASKSETASKNTRADSRFDRDTTADGSTQKRSKEKTSREDTSRQKSRTSSGNYQPTASSTTPEHSRQAHTASSRRPKSVKDTSARERHEVSQLSAKLNFKTRSNGPSDEPSDIDDEGQVEYVRNYRLQSLNREFQNRMARYDHKIYDCDGLVRHYIAVREKLGFSVRLYKYQRSLAGSKRKAGSADVSDDTTEQNARTAKKAKQNTATSSGASSTFRNVLKSPLKDAAAQSSSALGGQSSADDIAQSSATPTLHRPAKTQQKHTSTSTFPTSTTPAKSAPEKAIVEAPNSSVPVAPGTTDFMAAFAKQSAENAAKMAADIKKKRKAEDFDSEEDDEEEWERKYEEELRAKRAKMAIVGQGFTPTLGASPSGFTPTFAASPSGFTPTLAASPGGFTPSLDANQGDNKKGGFTPTFGKSDTTTTQLTETAPVETAKTEAASLFAPRTEATNSVSPNGTTEQTNTSEGDESSDEPRESDDDEHTADAEDSRDEESEDGSDRDSEGGSGTTPAQKDDSDSADAEPPAPIGAGLSLFDRITRNPNLNSDGTPVNSTPNREFSASGLRKPLNKAFKSSAPMFGSSTATPTAPDGSPITPASYAPGWEPRKEPVQPAAFNFNASAYKPPTLGVAGIRGPLPGEGLFGSRPSTPLNVETASTGKPAGNVFGSTARPLSSLSQQIDNTWKDGTPIKFGGDTLTDAPSVNITAATPPLKNDDLPKPTQSLFGSNAFQPASSSVPSLGFGFGFGGPPKPSFLGIAPHLASEMIHSASSSRATSPGLTDNESVATNENDSTDDEPAPALADSQTSLMTSRAGEENETVLYEGRAKALKFVNAEAAKDSKLTANSYNTMGLGALRILKNNQTGKTRMVLRAEPAANIILNENLHPSMEYLTDEQGRSGNVKFGIPTEKRIEKWVLKVKTKEMAEELAAILQANKGL